MAAVPIIAVAANNPPPPSPRRSSTSHANSPRRSSQHSVFAKNVLMSRITLPGPEHALPRHLANGEHPRPASAQPTVPSAAATARSVPFSKDLAPHADLKPLPQASTHHGQLI